MQIRDADPFPFAVVDYGGVRKDACLAYIPDAEIGQYVIVHVGFAIARVDEEEALRTLDVLRAMGDQVAQELGQPLGEPLR
jgi:hydrogenase expression/formation protein HypC